MDQSVCSVVYDDEQSGQLYRFERSCGPVDRVPARWHRRDSLTDSPFDIVKQTHRVGFRNAGLVPGHGPAGFTLRLGEQGQHRRLAGASRRDNYRQRDEPAGFDERANPRTRLTI